MLFVQTPMDHLIKICIHPETTTVILYGLKSMCSVGTRLSSTSWNLTDRSLKGWVATAWAQHGRSPFRRQDTRLDPPSLPGDTEKSAMRKGCRYTAVQNNTNNLNYMNMCIYIYVNRHRLVRLYRRIGYSIRFG